MITCVCRVPFGGKWSVCMVHICVLPLIFVIFVNMDDTFVTGHQAKISQNTLSGVSATVFLGPAPVQGWL